MALDFASLARQSGRESSSVRVPKGENQPGSRIIHTLGSDELRQPARRVGKVDGTTRELARSMLRSMYAARGIGLAAPQLGEALQLLVIDLDPEEAANPPLVLINPTIQESGGELCAYEEGCLSIPGVYLHVVRPSRIDVSFRDEMGRPQRRKADGLLARCILHEMDHLSGVLFVDRVSDRSTLESELAEKGFDRDHVRPMT